MLQSIQVTGREIRINRTSAWHCHQNGFKRAQVPRRCCEGQVHAPHVQKDHGWNRALGWPPASFRHICYRVGERKRKRDEAVCLCWCSRPVSECSAEQRQRQPRHSFWLFWQGVLRLHRLYTRLVVWNVNAMRFVRTVHSHTAETVLTFGDCHHATGCQLVR